MEPWIQQRDVPFWARHVRLGIIASGIVSLLVLGYIYAVGAPRILWILAFTGFASLFGLLLPIERMVSSRWAPIGLLTWSLSLAGMITVATAADGGLDSPLPWINVAVLVFAGIAYPPIGVAIVGGAMLLLTGSIAIAYPPSDGLAGVGFRLSMLLLITVLAALSADGHWRRHHHARRLADHLALLAHTDALTGCANHRALFTDLGHRLAEATQQGGTVALLMCDVDHFKQVNDRWGHGTGDDVLATIGELLRTQVGDNGLVARAGGEEFAIVAPGVGAADAYLLGEQLRRAVADTRFGADDRELHITISVGVAATESGMLTAQQLFDRADHALYTAKRGGRDRVAAAAPTVPPTPPI